MTRFRWHAVAVALLVAWTLSGCDLLADNPAPSNVATAGPTTPPPPSDTPAALAAGPWRPAPIVLPDEMKAASEHACRNSADPRGAAALQDVPVVLADARGDSIITLIFADDSGAYECRVELQSLGGTPTVSVLQPPTRLAAGTPPHDAVSIVSDSRVEDDAGARTVLIGRVEPAPYRVVATFDDESHLEATHDGGWYVAWWPGSERPGSVAAVNRQSISEGGAPSPHDEIEGRVSSGTWWLDPSAPGPTPGDTIIHALVRENACAGGRSPKGRIVEPVIFQGDDAVIVEVFVRRLPGAKDCQGSQPASFGITLSQPLGDRRLLDGSEIPARDAAHPPP